MKKLFLVVAVLAVSVVAISQKSELKTSPKSVTGVEPTVVTTQAPNGLNSKVSNATPEVRAEQRVVRLESEVGPLTASERKQVYDLFLTQEREREMLRNQRAQSRAENQTAATARREKYANDLKKIIGDEKYDKHIEIVNARRANRNLRGVNRGQKSNIQCTPQCNGNGHKHGRNRK